VKEKKRKGVKDMARDDQTQHRGRGFASMDPEERREIASKGGSMSGGNFKNDPERAREAGRKGGKA
jgi:general stress protein YciG